MNEHTKVEPLTQEHTPGPWECWQHKFPLPPFEGALEGEWGIYPPLGESGPVAIASGEANARLIASAPAMAAELTTLRADHAALQAQMTALLPALRFANAALLVTIESGDDEEVLQKLHDHSVACGLVTPPELEEAYSDMPAVSALRAAVERAP